jgi:sporulation protein YlmC with PRC-barrel domain
MRARELLGQQVIDSLGQPVGWVTDLRCIQDGPLRGAMRMPRIHALVISRHRTGSLLGYDRREQQGPWMIRAAVRLLHRHLLVVPWSLVERYDGPIVLKREHATLR